MEPKRAHRRRDLIRMKTRATYILRYVWRFEVDDITPARVGGMAAMHGTHQCKMCNYWKHDGTNQRPFSELRHKFIDKDEFYWE